MSHFLQWSKDEEDDDEKPAVHSFLKPSEGVLDL